MSAELVASERGPGLFTAPGIALPDDLRLAPHVTIYAGVEIGRGVSIEQGAIVGRPQQVDSRSRTPPYPPDALTTIGDGCRIGSHVVVVRGATLSQGVYVADNASIREGASVDDEAMIGRGVAVSHGVRVGSRTRVQNDTVIGPRTAIDEDVLVGARVTFLSDETMGRRSLNGSLPWIVVRRASRIGTGAIIFPGVRVGEEAVVGAGAIVRDDVPDRMVVTGSPARPLRPVRGDELLESWREPA